MLHRTETLPGGTRVWMNDVHRFGSDALLLARFAQPRKGWSACDLGSGCGILILALWDMGLRGEAVGVEQAADGTALLRGAAEESGAAIQAVQGDLRDYRPSHLFDLVVANPPYFTHGLKAQNAARAAARHDGTGALADFCAAASRLLKDRGRFTVCYPANRLATLFCEMQAQRLEPKRMQLVRTGPEREPWLALVEARKAGGEGLTILPDRILPPGQPETY